MRYEPQHDLLNDLEFPYERLAALALIYQERCYPLQVSVSLKPNIQEYAKCKGLAHSVLSYLLSSASFR